MNEQELRRQVRRETLEEVEALFDKSTFGLSGADQIALMNKETWIQELKVTLNRLSIFCSRLEQLIADSK